MTWYAGACEQQREDSQPGFAMPPLAEVLEQNFFALSMSLTRKAQGLTITFFTRHSHCSLDTLISTNANLTSHLTLLPVCAAALDDELLGDLRLLEGYLHLFGSSIRLGKWEGYQHHPPHESLIGTFIFAVAE